MTNENLPRIFLKSFRQAWQSLFANKLRSFLSLLGITIGIFCIIGVLSAVDSLKDNIVSSFDALGQDVIYVNRFSWTEDPMGNYWKWRKNPQPSYKDFKAIQTKVKGAKLVGYYVNIGQKMVKYKSKAIDFSLYLSIENIIIGLSVSIFTGILAGFIPAYQAAKMNPVVAMRN